MRTEAETLKTLANNLDAYLSACREADAVRAPSPFSPDGPDETRLFHVEQTARFAWERCQALAWVLEFGSIELERQLRAARARLAALVSGLPRVKEER